MPKRTAITKAHNSGRVSKGNRIRIEGTHKWTQLEVDTVLDYMLETIQSNKKIDEPSAASYYNTMANSLDLSGLNANKIKCKVQSLKKSYMEMVEWRGRTGQGILENSGIETVKSYITKCCPDFDKLEEIFGNKASVNPPYVHESDHVDDDMIVFEEGDVLAEISNSQRVDLQVVSPQIGETSSKKKEFKIGMSEIKKESKKDPLSTVMEAHKLRIEQLQFKNKLENDRFESEKEWKAKYYQLELDKLQADKELKIKELEKSERLEKFKLELEQKERLEKLKLELEFKLQAQSKQE